jgi:hypothetical protein
MSFLLHKVFLIFLGNQTVFFYHKMDPARLKFNKHNVFKSYRDVFLLLYIIFLICEFVTGVTQQVPLVEQELIILKSPSVFSGVHVAWSLVFCVVFADHCLSFCPSSFDHCYLCPFTNRHLCTFLNSKVHFYHYFPI